MDFVLEKLKGMGFAADKTLMVRLALEEALVNVIQYAYPEGKGKLELGCSVESQEKLELSIRDWGPPFDPLSRKAPDLVEDVMKRPIGGLGIYLVRQMTDELSYVREQNGNLLTLGFHI